MTPTTTDTPLYHQQVAKNLAPGRKDYYQSHEQACELLLLQLQNEVGEDAPQIAWLMRRLATICNALGKTTEAELLHDKANGLTSGKPRPLGGSAAFYAILGYESQRANSLDKLVVPTKPAEFN
jgi:hypothetical protein